MHLHIQPKRRLRHSDRLLAAAVLVVFGMRVASAAVAVPLGQVEVGGRIQAIRATADGRRAVVVLSHESGDAELRIIDTSQPEAPRLQGFVRIDEGIHGGTFLNVALSPDGLQALIANSLEVTDLAELIDLSDAQAPRVLWRREMAAQRKMALANDSSAYAVSTPTAAASWVDGKRESVTLEKITGQALTMSEHAGFLAAFSEGLSSIDLRGPKPVRFEEELPDFVLDKSSGEDISLGAAYWCAAIRDDGTVVAHDRRVSGQAVILTTQNSRLSRASTLATRADLDRICEPLNRHDSAKDWLYRTRTAIIRLDLHDVKHPSIDGYWTVRGSYTVAVAASILFGQGGASVVTLSKLDNAARTPVDWLRLDAVYSAGLGHSHHRPARGARTTAAALDALESAGIFNAIGAPVVGISETRAAMILHDYGTVAMDAGADPAQGDVATFALRRALELDALSTR